MSIVWWRSNTYTNRGKNIGSNENLYIHCIALSTHKKRFCLPRRIANWLCSRTLFIFSISLYLSLYLSLAVYLIVLIQFSTCLESLSIRMLWIATYIWEILKIVRVNLIVLLLCFEFFSFKDTNATLTQSFIHSLAHTAMWCAVAVCATMRRIQPIWIYVITPLPSQWS